MKECYSLEKQESQGLLEALQMSLKHGPGYLVIDGPVASGKTELTETLISEFSDKLDGEPMVLNVDWVVHSREYRNQLTIEQWGNQYSWFRLHRHYGLLHQYLRAQKQGLDKVGLTNFYRHGEFGLDRTRKDLAITRWTIVEGVFTLSEESLSIFARHGVEPVTLMVESSCEDRIKWVRQRAPSNNQNPDEQEKRMWEVFEPNWLARKEKVIRLAQWKAKSKDGLFRLSRTANRE